MGEDRPRRRPQVGAGSLTPSDHGDDGTLFPSDTGRTAASAAADGQDPTGAGLRSVTVLPDVPAVDRPYDYTVPEQLGDRVRVGTMVRVPFHGRRVAGWVLDADSVPPDGVLLRPIAKVSGEGPDPDVIDLCRWAAWRWAGRFTTMLRVASPERMLGRRPPLRTRPATGGDADRDGSAALAAGPGVTVLEVPPGADPTAIAVAAARTGQALVVHPSVVVADRIARSLRRAGASVARWPVDFAAAAGGATVVGGRAAAFAPLPALSAVVVIDEDDPGLQNESSPTWNAREVAIERARRAGVPCLLVSPCPSVVAREVADRVVHPAGTGARNGWSPLVVVDRREEDVGRSGLFSSQLVEAVRDSSRAGARVLCILNRTGRARLLACRSCGTVAECERCGSAVHLTDRLDLVCDRCGERRPSICLECGSTALSVLRPGVSKAREELEALVRERVGLVTASTPAEESASTRVVIGTSAVLHRTRGAGLVAFLDFDQELLGRGYRSAEEALRSLALASRSVRSEGDGSGRPGAGAGQPVPRVLVQTRLPGHPVLQAALLGDPDRLAASEADKRALLGFPPSACVAVVGGTAGPEFVGRLGAPAGIEVLGPDDQGSWLLRSEDRAVLLDALRNVERPPGRLRLWVDPVRTA